MLLLIDNYDSFTYNLYQYLGELGETIEVYRNDKITIEQIAQKKPRGIIISPGPGRPSNAGICIELIRSLHGKIPILGVCLGHQAIGVAFGSSIVCNKDIYHGKVSDIYHDNKGMFEGIEYPFIAGRYHSLIIDEATLSDEFIVTCRTKDDVIMGIRHKKFLTEGIQFHPESCLTLCGKTLLKNFLCLIDTF